VKQFGCRLLVSTLPAGQQFCRGRLDHPTTINFRGGESKGIKSLPPASLKNFWGSWRGPR
jgi:hypothetical protein